MFQNKGFQSFGQPVKLKPMGQGQAPAPGPKPVVPNPQSPAAAPKGFIPKSPGSGSCPICR